MNTIKKSLVKKVLPFLAIATIGTGVAITEINDAIFNKRLENLTLPSESPGIIIDEYTPSKNGESQEEYNELSEELSTLLKLSRIIKPGYLHQYPVKHTDI